MSLLPVVADQDGYTTMRDPPQRGKLLSLAGSTGAFPCVGKGGRWQPDAQSGGAPNNSE
jgi:hypothetical protein